jgi:hypothetical protein
MRHSDDGGEKMKKRQKTKWTIWEVKFTEPIMVKAKQRTEDEIQEVLNESEDELEMAEEQELEITHEARLLQALENRMEVLQRVREQVPDVAKPSIDNALQAPVKDRIEERIEQESD